MDERGAGFDTRRVHHHIPDKTPKLLVDRLLHYWVNAEKVCSNQDIPSVFQ